MKVQAFSQKGVPLLEEIQGKSTQSLINLSENKPPGCPVLNVWLKTCEIVVNEFLLEE